MTSFLIRGWRRVIEIVEVGGLYTRGLLHFFSAERTPQTQTVFRPQLPEVKFSPQITLPASPPRKAVDIFIHSVAVYSTKDGSEVWDESGPPDLKVKITNLDNGDSYCTSTSQDTESADFNHKAIRVYEGQKIEIEVLDGDVFVDDTVGSLVKEVSADTMASGKVDWTFDRVSSLVIEFQP